MKTTKQFFYSLIFFCGSIILLSACGGDDEDEFSLVGTYTMSKESTSGCADPADNGSETKSCTASDCETLIINNDGGFSVIEIDNGITTTITGTYITSGNTITFTFNGVDTEVVTYSLSASGVVFTFDEDSDGCVEVITYTRK